MTGHEISVLEQCTDAMSKVCLESCKGERSQCADCPLPLAMGRARCLLKNAKEGNNDEQG